MRNLITAFAVLAAVTIPASVLAQDAAAPAADAPAAEAPAAGSPAPADNGLSMGAPEEGGVGSTYVAEEFGAWALRCVRSGNEADPCQLYQLLKDDQGTPVAEMAIFTVADGGEAVGGANVITPLETLLTANLRMAVDSGNAKVYPFAFCNVKGCYSRLGFTEEDLASFRKGAVANIAIVPAAAPKEQVVLKASLSGFTAGWTALVEANAAATKAAQAAQAAGAEAPKSE